MSDAPVMSYDADTRIVTIDGYGFSRELFQWITAQPLGTRVRIISRDDGVVTITQERDPMEAAAPQLFTALRDLSEFFAYGLSKAPGAFPTAEDERRVEELARAAVDALNAADPTYVQTLPPAAASLPKHQGRVGE